MSDPLDLKKHIREVNDFPIPGIQFRDITSLIETPKAFKKTCKRLTELTENSHQAWMSRIEGEEEQIRKAEWNSMLKNETVDPRWLRMKRGIIRSLHEQLSNRVIEIERIRDDMQANISFPIIVRII